MIRYIYRVYQCHWGSIHACDDVTLVDFILPCSLAYQVRVIIGHSGQVSFVVPLVYVKSIERF